MGKKIKGEGGKDKRKVLGKRERDFWTFVPEKLRERKTRKKAQKKREKGGVLSLENLDSLK